jgi:hypothetical protein
VVTALLIVATIGLLMVALWIVIPIGQATDKRAKAQTAADAAALAGAQQARDELIAAMLTGYPVPVPVPTDPNPDPFEPMLCGVGATQAASYAEANDTQVTSYCFASALHQAQVRVRGNWAAKNGSRAQAAADAELGRDIEPCHWGPAPLPPAIVPGAKLQLHCGTLRAWFTLDATTGRLRLDTTATPVSVVEDLLKPRLVS